MLVLFARTDREKEEWFNLFKKSSSNRLLDSVHYLKQNKTTRSSSNKTINVNLSSSSSTANISLNTSALNLKASDLNESTNLTNIDAQSTNLKTAQTQTESNQIQLNSSITFMNTFLIRLIFYQNIRVFIYSINFDCRSGVKLRRLLITHTK